MPHCFQRTRDSNKENVLCDSTYKRLTNRMNTIRTVAVYVEQGLTGKGRRELSERDGNVLCLIGVLATQYIYLSKPFE